MQVEVVEMASMRPDPNNPRNDFGDIDALAESFRANPMAPGEPFNPPVMVRDGNVCRIVDGERRYRAMSSLGLDRCNALVCEDMDEANSALAMLATDDKLQLTDAERSRGVQQALMLGVDERTVERLGRVERGSGARIKRGRRIAGEKADQMTLEHLLAIAEAEEAGDDEAAAALAAAPSTRRDWRIVESDWKTFRAFERGHEALVSACESLGVPVVDKRPKGSVVVDTIYSLNNKDEEGLRQLLESVKGRPGGDLVVATEAPTFKDPYVHPDICRRAPKLSEKEAAAKSTRTREKSAMTAAKKRRAQFAGRLLVEDVGALKHTLGLFCTDFATDEYEVCEFAKKADIDVSEVECWTSPYFMASKWPYRDSMTQSDLMDIMFENRRHMRAKASARKFVRLLDALVADGYEPDEHEQRLCKTCRAILKQEEDD